jgi:hypothetical protein
MSDSGNTAPPGWYDDGKGGQRWWDGSRWGPEGQPPATPTTPMPTSPPPTSPPPTIATPTSAPPTSAPQPSYGTAGAAAAGYPPPGPDYGTPSTAGPGNRKGLLIGLIGGLVGVVVLVIILVIALGGSGPSSDDPAETVQSFFDAARDGDCDAAVELLTDNAQETLDPDDCESADPAEEFGDSVELEVGDAEIDGDDATVPVSLAVDPDSEELEGLGSLIPSDVTIDFQLTKVDGAWLIDDFGFGSLLENLPDFSDLPDDPFSDLPEDPFSDLPTDLFSDFPTDLFSDFPTDLFSDFPTDFDPEDFLSDFPTDLFTDLPTE